MIAGFHRKSRILPVIIGGVLIVFLLSSPGKAGPADSSFPYTIKMATLAPENTIWGYVSKTLFVPLGREMFGNHIRTVVYYGGVMGEDADIIRKMKLGQIHGCACNVQGVVKAVPELSVLTLPMLFESFDEVDYITRQLRRYIESAFEHNGYYLLTIVDTGFLYLFSKENPSTLNRIRQNRVHYWFGEIQERTFQSMGISPIPTAVPEIITSLASGMTDAGAAPPSWVLATQTYLYLNYVLEPPLFYGPAMVFIEKKYLDELTYRLVDHPEEFREIKNAFSHFQKTVTAESFISRVGIHDENIQNGVRQIIPWLKEQRMEDPQDFRKIFMGVFSQLEGAWSRAIREFDQECLEGFLKRGMKRVRMTENDHRRLLLITRKVWDEFSGTLYPPELLAGIRKRLIEYRANKQGWNRGRPGAE